ncbi:ATP-binding protein, partial [Nocardioides hankookensis]
MRSLVARLDGLPLAVELAAAKVRVMSVVEIERRIEDRFTLLRGGSRDAPERHQTLLAVIDWSWNLLRDQERVALRRLSVFRDGFSFDGAEAVVGDDALGALANLVDQSLVTVVEGGGELRYRLLETVREFGQMQLVGAGDDGDTVERLRDWGVAYARRCAGRLFGPEQVDTMNAIRAEEGNLVDLLRRCLRGRDADAVVVLMACLSDFWTIEGSHLKVVNVAPDVEDVVADATISPELEDAFRATLVAIAFNSMIFTDSAVGRAFDRLEALGPGDRGSRSGISATVLLAARATVEEGHLDAVEAMCDDPDRRVAQLALQWSSQFHENQGEIKVAQERGRQALALTDDADGPWSAALVRAQLAGLTMQVGEMAEAMEFAQLAIPTLDALGADEDVAQLKAVLAMGALEGGRIDEAQRIFDEIEASDGATGIFGAAIILLCGRPEL